MAARLIAIVAILALLSACRAPVLTVEPWGDGREPACWEAHENGVWKTIPPCHRGKGFIVWADWTM